MGKFLVSLVLLQAVLSAYSLTQDELNYMADNLKVTFEVVDNVFKDERSKIRITLNNDGDSMITQGPWELYLYDLFMIEPDHLPDNDYAIPDTGLVVSHENGNLFKMVPNGFSDLAPGASLAINLVTQFWHISKSDVMPNWYLTGEGLVPKTIKSTADGTDFVTDFTKPEQYKRYANDTYRPFTYGDRYDRYDHKTNSANKKIVIPTPVKVEVYEEQGAVTITDGWSVKCDSFMDECTYLAGELNLNVNENSSTNMIIFQQGEVIGLPDGGIKEESYNLKISSEAQINQITITATTASGAFYGSQSLLSLYSESNGEIQSMMITDAPRFAYRGMHLDVARNFITKDQVENLLKVMAMYKLNHFHFHLTDDEGWRLQLDSYPELTDVASKRAHDPEERNSIIPQFGSGPDQMTSGTGRYTKAEYKEILQLADNLHIKVIPEFDFPGHTHAAIKANLVRYNKALESGASEEDAASILISDLEDESDFLSIQMWTDNAVNPCVNGTYDFVKTIVSELEELHKDIQPLTDFHIGGDEVADAWTNSPKCEELFARGEFPTDPEHLLEYFMSRASEAVTSATSSDLGIAVWEDGALESDGTPYDISTFAGSEVTAYTWQNIWEWGVAERAYRLANAGYKVVLSPATHLYFDQPQEPDPEERGQYWASRYTDTRKAFSFMPEDLYANADVKRSGETYTEAQMCAEQPCPALEREENIIGIQGHLWSEEVRKTEHLHYMIFPRMLALAERAWHKSDWEATQSRDLDTAARDQDWVDFAATVGGKELERLDEIGVKYRIAVPGASVSMLSKDEGEIRVNCELSTMDFVWRPTTSDNWSNPQPCGTSVTINDGESYVIAGVSTTGNRYGRSITVSFTGGSSKIQANLFIVFLMCLLSASFLG